MSSFPSLPSPSLHGKRLRDTVPSTIGPSSHATNHTNRSNQNTTTTTTITNNNDTNNVASSNDTTPNNNTESLSSSSSTNTNTASPSPSSPSPQLSTPPKSSPASPSISVSNSDAMILGAFDDDSDRKKLLRSDSFPTTPFRVVIDGPSFNNSLPSSSSEAMDFIALSRHLQAENFRLSHENHSWRSILGLIMAPQGEWLVELFGAYLSVEAEAVALFTTVKEKKNRWGQISRKEKDERKNDDLDNQVKEFEKKSNNDDDEKYLPFEDCLHAFYLQQSLLRTHSELRLTFDQYMTALNDALNKRHESKDDAAEQSLQMTKAIYMRASVVLSQLIENIGSHLQADVISAGNKETQRKIKIMTEQAAAARVANEQTKTKIDASNPPVTPSASTAQSSSTTSTTGLSLSLSDKEGNVKKNDQKAKDGSEEKGKGVEDDAKNDSKGSPSSTSLLTFSSNQPLTPFSPNVLTSPLSPPIHGPTIATPTALKDKESNASSSVALPTPATSLPSSSSSTALSSSTNTISPSTSSLPSDSESKKSILSSDIAPSPLNQSSTESSDLGTPTQTSPKRSTISESTTPDFGITPSTFIRFVLPSNTSPFSSSPSPSPSDSSTSALTAQFASLTTNSPSSFAFPHSSHAIKGRGRRSMSRTEAREERRRSRSRSLSPDRRRELEHERKRAAGRRHSDLDEQIEHEQRKLLENAEISAPAAHLPTLPLFTRTRSLDDPPNEGTPTIPLSPQPSSKSSNSNDSSAPSSAASLMSIPRPFVSFSSSTSSDDSLPPSLGPSLAKERSAYIGRYNQAEKVEQLAAQKERLLETAAIRAKQEEMRLLLAAKMNIPLINSSGLASSAPATNEGQSSNGSSSVNAPSSIHHSPDRSSISSAKNSSPDSHRLGLSSSILGSRSPSVRSRLFHSANGTVGESSLGPGIILQTPSTLSSFPPPSPKLGGRSNATLTKSSLKNSV